jgi:hypothetical protein
MNSPAAHLEMMKKPISLRFGERKFGRLAEEIRRMAARGIRGRNLSFDEDEIVAFGHNQAVRGAKQQA